MKNRDDKQKDLEALRKELEQAKNLFITGYEKLKVSQDFELRKTVRGAGGRYRVIKNNLAEKASEMSVVLVEPRVPPAKNVWVMTAGRPEAAAPFCLTPETVLIAPAVESHWYCWTAEKFSTMAW